MNVSDERLRELADNYENATSRNKTVTEDRSAHHLVRTSCEIAARKYADVAAAIRAVLAVREFCQQVEMLKANDMDEPLGARRMMLEGLRAIVGAAEDGR